MLLIHPSPAPRTQFSARADSCGSARALCKAALAADAANSPITRTTDAILSADAMLVCTGTGMGVDSGFGTFRGRHAGVWAPLKALGIDYADICSPHHF